MKNYVATDRSMANQFNKIVCGKYFRFDACKTIASTLRYLHRSACEHGIGVTDRWLEIAESILRYQF